MLRSTMPPDAALDTALDVCFAPSQLYIVLAITVATFGWLLKPESLGSLSGLQVTLGALLVFVQAAHLVLYPALQPRYNAMMHGAMLALYMLTALWLFGNRWREAKSRPPNSPTP